MIRNDLHVVLKKLTVAEHGIDKAANMMIEVEIALREQGHIAEANKLKRHISTLTTIRHQVNTLLS